MNNNLAPIVLFVYNRLDHTKKTIDALSKNELANETDLYVYSDAPANITKVESVLKVREYLKTIKGFKSIKIIEREYNYGIERSVATAVTEVVNKYGKIIVVEDDIVTSKYFIKFMNTSLDFYKDNDKVSVISGYNHPNSLLPIPKDYQNDVYFFQRNCSSGWGTWSSVINKVKWDYSLEDDILSDRIIRKKIIGCGEDIIDMIKDQLQKNNSLSWDVCVTIHQCINNLYTLYPCFSYVNNIGFDNSGLHSPSTDIYYNDLNKSIENFKLLEEITTNKVMNKNYLNVYKKSFKGKIRTYINNFIHHFGYKIESL